MVDFQSRGSRRGSAERDDGDDETDAGTTDSEAVETTETEHSTDGDSGDSGFFVITVDADESAPEATDAVLTQLEREGRTVVGSDTVEASLDAVQSAINRAVSRGDTDAVLTIGGTGVGDADVTVDAVEPLLDKPLPGFGELFRVSYHERVGPAVIGM